jgi:alpha-N-arabinofuranosidase
VRGIYQSEIDISTGKLLSDIIFLWPGTGGGYPESPHLFKRGDYYYLTIAEGGTAECHMVTVARSKDPFGPFESCPHNPVLTHRSLMNPIQATGHADFFEDHQGNWWAVFLGIRYADFGFHNLGRETNLAPVEWTVEGWPVVHGGQKVTLEMEVARDLTMHPWPAPAPRDNFDHDKLALFWIFLRNPNPEDWSLTERRGSLRLRCSPVTLNELDSPAFIARRQQDFECRARTLIDFRPQQDHEEAGLAVLMDVDHHVEFVVTLRHGQRVAMVRRRVGTMVAETVSAPLADGPIELIIETNRKEYRFSVVNPGQAPVFVGHHELRYLSTQVAGGYVGVVLGLYAGSNGQPSANRAYFDWFEYEA